MVTHPVLVLLLAVATCFGGDVIELTPETYQVTLDHAPIFLVKYYAPWCGHCQNMAEDYEKAATALKADGIQIGDVDCIAHEELAEAAHIQGFPTIKFYRNGVFYKEYMGGREADDFINFMKAEAALSPDDIGEPEVENPAFEDGEQYQDPEAAFEQADEQESWPDQEFLEPRGFFNLDRYTFDKIVGVGKYHVVVKFDVMFPDASIENEFAMLTERVGNIQGDGGDELIVAAVHIADFDRFDNEDIRARYGFDMETLPKYVLWKKDAPNSELEHGFVFQEDEITADAVASFLMEHLGIYIGLPGCIKELDRLAAGFCGLNPDERGERIALAEKVVEALSADPSASGDTIDHATLVENSKFYVDVMTTVNREDDGFHWIATQKEELKDNLAQGGMDLPEHERNTLNYKINILTIFEEPIGENADF